MVSSLPLLLVLLTMQIPSLQGTENKTQVDYGYLSPANSLWTYNGKLRIKLNVLIMVDWTFIMWTCGTPFCKPSEVYLAVSGLRDNIRLVHNVFRANSNEFLDLTAEWPTETSVIVTKENILNDDSRDLAGAYGLQLANRLVGDYGMKIKPANSVMLYLYWNQSRKASVEAVRSMKFCNELNLPKFIFINIGNSSAYYLDWRFSRLILQGVGISLGAIFDGKQPAGYTMCSASDGYIMGNDIENNYNNRYLFSCCSMKNMYNVLRNPLRTCIMNTDKQRFGFSPFRAYYQRYMGEVGIDAMCSALNATSCSSPEDATTVRDICKEAFCGKCRRSDIRPADGVSCDTRSKGFCSFGRCSTTVKALNWTKAPCDMQEFCETNQFFCPADSDIVNTCIPNNQRCHYLYRPCLTELQVDCCLNPSGAICENIDSVPISMYPKPSSSKPTAWGNVIDYAILAFGGLFTAISVTFMCSNRASLYRLLIRPCQKRGFIRAWKSRISFITPKSTQASCSEGARRVKAMFPNAVPVENPDSFFTLMLGGQDASRISQMVTPDILRSIQMRQLQTQLTQNVVKYWSTHFSKILGKMEEAESRSKLASERSRQHSTEKYYLVSEYDLSKVVPMQESSLKVRIKVSNPELRMSDRVIATERPQECYPRSSDEEVFYLVSEHNLMRMTRQEPIEISTDLAPYLREKPNHSSTSIIKLTVDPAQNLRRP